MRFARKAHEIKKDQPELACRYIIQASNLYNQKLHRRLDSTNRKDDEYNAILISFLSLYPLEKIRRLKQIPEQEHALPEFVD